MAVKGAITILCLLHLALTWDAPNGKAQLFNEQTDVCPFEIKESENLGIRHYGLSYYVGINEFSRSKKRDICYAIFNKTQLDQFNNSTQEDDMLRIEKFCKANFHKARVGQTSLWARLPVNQFRNVANQLSRWNPNVSHYRFYDGVQLQTRIPEILNKQASFELPSRRTDRLFLTDKHYEENLTYELGFLSRRSFHGIGDWQYEVLQFGFYDSIPVLYSDFFLSDDYSKYLANRTFHMYLPWCRDVIFNAKSSTISLDKEFYTCNKQQKWEWFTCTFPPYKHCYDKRISRCSWNKNMSACMEFAYERMQERDPPYGRECEPRDYGEPCEVCETCDTNPWGPWSAWSVSCGNATRSRLRPPDGLPNLDCKASELDCCEMVQKQYIPCTARQDNRLTGEMNRQKNPVVYFLLIPATFALIICLATLYIVFKARRFVPGKETAFTPMSAKREERAADRGERPRKLSSV
uniref:Uncharacterized protein n=1 Tax=Trichuris muris TaxID=70415 RepID=A0A5S6R3A9_TRIMR